MLISVLQHLLDLDKLAIIFSGGSFVCSQRRRASSSGTASTAVCWRNPSSGGRCGGGGDSVFAKDSRLQLRKTWSYRGFDVPVRIRIDVRGTIVNNNGIMACVVKIRSTACIG